ncbi:DNA-binding transcription factor cat8 [Lecanora helva]
MPGILPMKVIKVGTSAQSRIAQACDRCRSKKIRCDGITPCCSQCANVGFECKTSDKLSRRAFPRGYTESLEERVRALESEVKDLKDLLDEKDEKIDILSRIHSNAPSVRRPSSTLSSSVDLVDVNHAVEDSPSREDTFRVQQPPCLLDGDESESYFMGASSGRPFVDTFKAKVQEIGKSCNDFNPEAFFAVKKSQTLSDQKITAFAASKLPPRLVADQLINIYFQEWAPLFPVVHRPTVLKVYTEYMSNPHTIQDMHAVAQLHLIFSIASISAEGAKQSTNTFDEQWQAALDVVLPESTLSTLQCLVLAQMYCIAKADYNRLLQYKGMAINISHRLGLHQSQKRFSLGALTSETRKKVFWTLYTLDCFSAATLGLPKLLNNADIHAEYPADVDDENVSEQGFQSTLPGESTRVSSALALYRLSRILSKVLDENYPAASSHDLSLQTIGALNDELEVWLGSLPSHLRLQFVQDKPSTNVVGSRSPLLSLGYHYIRTLVHRPVVGSSLGNKASSSIVALAQSSKHILQIIQLLEERRMSFSLCVNKNEMLLLAGFGLLFQGLNLDRKSKLVQDSQRLLCSIIEILERREADCAAEFKKVTCAMISIERFSKSARTPNDSVSQRQPDGDMDTPTSISRPGRKLQAIASRFPTETNLPVIKQESGNGRRSTAPSLLPKDVPYYARSNSQNSMSSAMSEPLATQYSKRMSISHSPHQNEFLKPPNLDYLSFSNDHSASSHSLTSDSSAIVKQYEQSTCLNGGLGPENPQPLDSFCSSSDIFTSYITPSPSANVDWCSDIWNLTTDLGNQQPQSRISFSEEELTSGEELSNCELGGEFNNMSIPNVDDLAGLEGLDGNFGI